MDRLLQQEPEGTQIDKLKADLQRAHRYYVDKTVPHLAARWIGLGFLAVLFSLRIYQLQGFYIVAYGLGIYVIGQLIEFLSPQADPDGHLSLPLKDSGEFKPFIRKLPEFKFWYGLTKAFLTALAMTVFPFFDLPVFWPILLVYWVVLFSLSMRVRIAHMIKHKYIPFDFGKKQRYTKQQRGSMSRD